MTKKRELMFSIVRGLLAILIALLVATLLIFISANGESVSEKLSSSVRSASCKEHGAAFCADIGAAIDAHSIGMAARRRSRCVSA